MERFTFSRLDLARRRRGFTKKRLADDAELSARALTAYERGENVPSEATVERLASVLGFPVSFFTAPDIDEPTIDSVSFRSKSSMTARQRDQACGSAALATVLGDWIAERFELPSPDVPRLRDVDPESAAEEVRVAWGLGLRRAPNMVHLLEAHGVRVFSLVEECAEVDAFSFWRGSTPYVFLNTMKSSEHSRMDAAHELGHLVLHFWGGPGGRLAEDEAKAFASAFLMPRDSVIADAPRGASIPQIVAAKSRWRVSAMALAYRMSKIGLLTEWQARSVFIEMQKLGYRTREPQGIPRESSQVFAQVFPALREEGLSMRVIGEHLGIPVAELNKVIFGLTLTGEQGAVGSRVSTRGRAVLRAVPDSP